MIRSLIRIGGERLGMLVAIVVVGWLACAQGALLVAQTKAAPSGHWVGSIPAGPGIAVEVDLDTKGDNAWFGTISLPTQLAKGLPLGDLTVKGNAVSFTIKGAPGSPGFSGTLAADGKTLNGDFSQNGASMPLQLTWKGDPQFEVAQKSTPITKNLEGSWEGALDINGKTLRLALKLANAEAGATGTIISLDQNNVEIPVATVTQDGNHLKLMATMIAGTFDGDVKGEEIAGTWTQGPLSVPLVFKRPAK